MVVVVGLVVEVVGGKVVVVVVSSAAAPLHAARMRANATKYHRSEGRMAGSVPTVRAS
jgi:hypothetical protein